MICSIPNQQQVGESNIDFKRFQYYLALKVEHYLELQKTSVCQRIYQISAKNQWQDRVKAINKMLNEQIIGEVFAHRETARDLAEELKPVIFKVISEINERICIHESY